MKRITVSILAFFLYHLANSQHNFLDRLNIIRSNGKVVITWTISSGNTCDGILIQRSFDAVNFISIGEIKGICGSVMQPSDYQFEDRNPALNRINYYRLEFGNAAISDVISIEVFDFGPDGYFVKPNPLVEGGKVYFNNDKGQRHYFTLYSLSGERVISLETHEDYFNLMPNQLSTGLYFFTIIPSDKKSVIPGKLVIK